MAEILGTVASILQLLDTVSKAWEHIQDFCNAPKEEKQIRLEMVQLEALLKRLRQEITANPTNQWTQNIHGPLTSFEGMMKEFTPKLGASTFTRQVKWALGGKKEAAEYLAKFEHFKSLLNIWLLVDLGDISRHQSGLLESVKSGMTNLESGMTNINNMIVDQQDAAERDQIIDWFSPINFFQQHADLASARQEETGGWLTRDPCFQDWKEGLGTTLWCRGIPGAGKTVLVSMVVDHLRQGTTTPSIWKQLVIGRRDISDVKALHEKHSEKKTTPSLAEIEKIVHSEVSKSNVYLVVDAVDEYPEELRQILLPALAAMGPTCNLMMTSRPHITPGPAFQNIKYLEIHADMDDIRAYVNMEIHKSPHLSKFVQKQPALKEEIHARISGRVDGIVLLAKLHMKALAEQRTAKKVWTALDNLPETLAETYADAMRRIDTQSKGDRQIAQAVLTWVTHAKQVLSVEDLKMALAIEPGAKELDDDDLMDIETIVGVCAGLIIVDEHLSVVRLVHYTTQEYMDSIASERFPGAHAKITETLLTFLSFDSVWELIATHGYPSDSEMPKLPPVFVSEQEPPKAHKWTLPPLIQYSQYCLTYAAGEPEKDSELQPRLLKFIHQVPFWLQFARSFWDQLKMPEEPSPLYVAASTNLLEIGGILIEQGEYLENMAEELASAAANGHYDMVRLLLNSGANVNAEYGWYGNALQAAVYQGHKGVVQLLIDHGAEVNAQGLNYGNALLAATACGSKEIVQLLIEHGAEVNAHSGWFGNALQAAAYEGNRELVPMLIDHGADVNAQGGQYGNALQATAYKGHKELLQLLIDHGADINAQGGLYTNALQAAAYQGHMELAQLLIDHGADVNAQGGQYANALQAAACQGHKDLVKLLTARGAKVNAQGGQYGNALQAAAGAVVWTTELVQLLIDHRADVNAQGGQYGNALQAAAAHGDKSSMQLLIEHGADVNASGGEYGHALQATAARGHKQNVQLLLEHGAEVNARGGQYGNALQAAAASGSKESLQLLIGHGADVNAQGGQYGNPLQAAAYMGNKEVVQLLIDHGADVNAQGGKYGNALQAVAANGHKRVVQLLIDYGADVNAQGGKYGNALQAAVVGGPWCMGAVQLLIDHGASMNAQGGEYGNALQAAAANGHKPAVQLLIDYGADVNAQGGKYGNALQAAVVGGPWCMGAVQLLIDHGADVNAQGGKYGNALQAVAANGHKRVVQLLIDYGADVNAQGGKYGNALQAAVCECPKAGSTAMHFRQQHGVTSSGGLYGSALQAAAMEGHKEIVQLLIDHGADVNAQGGKYSDALQVAEKSGRREIVQLLVEHRTDRDGLTRESNCLRWIEVAQ
ncbi:ankyrin repeat-containing domain protein [Mycena filopes]|nr:ankyrin repeat-containing domain protein [Mycena filopes]